MDISCNWMFRQGMFIRMIKNSLIDRIFPLFIGSKSGKIVRHMTVLIICLCVFNGESIASSSSSENPSIGTLVGEHLVYDISFLWFDHLAEGSLDLSAGKQPGTYLVTLEARTLGVAALVTRKRMVRYQTLMVLGLDGGLLPVWHSTHDIRGEGNRRKEKISKYTFDFSARTVRYEKEKNGRKYKDQWFELPAEGPVYDILTALYELRLGHFGSVAQQRILIPTFHHDGPQDIVVEHVDITHFADKDFFSGPQLVSKILVDPSVFGTKGRDIFASFDMQNRPLKGIIKDVIGLGDVKGTLRTF